VTWRRETGSTNADLVTLAREGAPPHGAVMVADHQTAGRGRMGRTWQAPPESALLCSILLRPPPGATLHAALWAVALAAQRALTEESGIDPELKWPNDLMVGSRKLAGILAETVGGSLDGAVVVGLGINVAWEEPPADVADRAVTVAELAGRAVDRRVLLRRVLASLAPLLTLWAERPSELHALYRARLSTLGQRVRVTLADRELEGEALDVTAQGSLIVRGDGETVEVSAGDVVHLRPA